MLINTGQIRFGSQLQKLKSPKKTRKVSKQDVATIVAQLRQRDGFNGFLPLVDLFCNVLTFPQTPPSSVLLTMPGSSRDLHLPLCFLHPCFLSCFLFFFHAQLIRPPRKQKKSTRARAHQRRHVQTIHFRFIFFGKRRFSIINKNKCGIS